MVTQYKNIICELLSELHFFCKKEQRHVSVTSVSGEVCGKNTWRGEKSQEQSRWLQSGPQRVSFSFFQVAIVALVIQQQQKPSTIFMTWLLCWSPISQPTYYQLTFLYSPLLPLSPTSLCSRSPICLYLPPSFLFFPVGLLNPMTKRESELGHEQVYWCIKQMVFPLECSHQVISKSMEGCLPTHHTLPEKHLYAHWLLQR